MKKPSSSSLFSTDLQFCIVNKDLNRCKLLLKEFRLTNFDVNSVTFIGSATPLSFAIYRENLDFVKLLLEEFNCDPNRISVDHLGRVEPPLCSAVRIGNVQIVETLINSSGIDLNQTDFFHQTPLWLAVKSRRIDLVELLISSRHFRIDVKLFRYKKTNPLYLAAKYLKQGRWKIAQLLINAGFETNCQDDCNEDSTIHYLTSVHQDACLINMLINAGFLISKKRVTLTLKAQARIFLRANFHEKTNKKSINFFNLIKFYPQLPDSLINYLCNLDLA